MTENEVMKTIMHRRAIRRFEEMQIAEDELGQILQAGMYAPSAGGRQGVIFAVCQDAKVNERLGKIKREILIPTWQPLQAMYRKSSPVLPMIRRSSMLFTMHQPLSQCLHREISFFR